MKLVIAEKPSVGVEIAKALGVHRRGNGFIQNNQWTITWCVGHLCTLKSPDEYDEKYKVWNLEDLPIIPKKYELKVCSKTEEQFNIVSRFLQNNKFECVINAADAGREGEAIFDNVYRMSNSKLPIKRLWTSSALTEDAIRKEFANLRPASDFDGLRIAARVRSACDWVIGMNATRAVTLHVKMHKQVFSIGRVQTPTLAFLVKRELEIINFKSNEFWSIQALFKSDNLPYEGVYKFKDKEDKTTHRIFEKNTAQELFKRLKNIKNSRIESIEKSQKKVSPPNLFDLTTLQKEANRIFGFTAEETLKIAQSLYEIHKVLSYPRTDYKHLPQEMKNEVKKILTSLKNDHGSNPYFEPAIIKLNGKCEGVFDNEKTGDHHALIPMAKLPVNLSENENKIYSMVLKRLLAALNEDHIYEATQVVTLVDESRFYSSGVVVVQNGWKDIYAFEENKDDDEPQKEKDNQTLPALKQNQTVSIADLKLKNDATKPPKRMNESDLLNCMQKPHLYIEKEDVNSEQFDSLKAKGLGTPATRANIIKGLIDRKYVTRNKKTLVPTEIGIILIENLEPESLKSPIMTSKWEEKLALIEQGKLKPAQFAVEMNNFVFEIIEKSENMGDKFKGVKKNQPKGKFFKKKITSLHSFLNR